MKKYKLSEGNVNEFWDLFSKKKKTPSEIQKIVDNDPILKKLQADYEKLDDKAGPVIHNIKKRSPQAFNMLVQMGLVPKDI
jgi:uncharacterized protein YdcH (DUF465 family)